MKYKWVRPLLFLLEPERAHAFTFGVLRYFPGLVVKQTIHAPRTVMGIEFPNPIGLAAGLDKNGEYLNLLARMGFGFIEIGTVTPKPQSGNPKPRLFRLPQQHALINRLGFNSKGVDYCLQQVAKANYSGVLGINIGKNLTTPVEKGVDDYLICLRKVYAAASYITVNISSPNTPGLRDLQHGDYLKQLLSALKQTQHELHQQTGNYKPLAVKVSPDLSDEEIAAMAKIFLQHHVDAVIATNTTIERPDVCNEPLADEQGGLSGKPLFEKSTHVLTQFHHTMQANIPLIGVGGIESTQDANKKFAAGAQLIQVYTGLIYQGPELLIDIAKGLSAESSH